jgi:DNA adenine methylase
MINTPSPFRYPGGKTILYEKVRKIIENNFLDNCTYIEPFAGGCGLALKLLFNNDVNNIIINDYDYAIFCVWDSILNNTQEFISKIESISITLEEWDKQKDIYINKDNYSKLEVAVATLFLNRTNVSGVIKGGPIGGRSQNGKYKIDCRFNKLTIIDKILKIAEYKNKIQLYNLEANELIDKIIIKTKKNTFTYLDPPYIQKGPTLYKNFFKEKDHKILSTTILKKLKDYNWIITYDNHPLVKEIYKNCKYEVFDLAYSAGNTKQGKEIMIYSKTLDKI